MSEPEIDPASIPLLFPDPVIEFYLAKIDRATIREQLRMTLEERLEAFERDQRRARAEKNPVAQEEPARWQTKKKKIDMGVDPAWFDEAKAVPLLFPDPVIEAYLEDVDRGLLRENLKLTVAERLDRFANFMNGSYELRGAALADKSQLWEQYPG